jgi:hypothetical protein
LTLLKRSLSGTRWNLQSVGYLVLYLGDATENEIIHGFADHRAAFIFSTGHGEPPGDIRTANEDRVEPGEITIPPGIALSQKRLGLFMEEDRIRPASSECSAALR